MNESRRLTSTLADTVFKHFYFILGMFVDTAFGLKVYLVLSAILCVMVLGVFGEIEPIGEIHICICVCVCVCSIYVIRVYIYIYI